MEKLSQLDELLSQSSQGTKVLTIDIDTMMASELSMYAKRLSVSRKKLVREIFLKGLEWFKTKSGITVSPDEVDETSISVVSGSAAFDSDHEK